MWCIHESLTAGDPVRLSALSRALEVSARTLKRDIERMRDFHGAPIAWDASRRSYVYTAACEFLPLLRFTADEALALVLAGRTFASWHGTPLGDAIASALAKVGHVIGGAISVDAAGLASFVSIGDTASLPTHERRWLALLLEAIQRRRVVRLVYRKPDRHPSTPSPREIHPLHLAFADHRWMLVAHDPARSGIRHFLLDRIVDAVVTTKSFAPPEGFDALAHLRGSIGRFSGESVVEIRIRFDSTVAPYVLERPWHRSQRTRHLPDGALEITLALNNLVDIQRHILACGRHAEVLAPAELRATIAAEAAALHALYSTPPTTDAATAANSTANFAGGTLGVPALVVASPSPTPSQS
ncbi:WYL domain-containing transcriptional regulator [Opitutales bacterium ASA1]|nr:WYL domain-containing transcriptional regulator [Opitutales bacterium ASA1]